MIIKTDAVKAFDFDGLEIRDYTSNISGSSSLAIIKVRSGAKHKRAWSKRSDKYYYLTRGEIDFTIDSNVHRLREGDFCLVRKGQIFSYENKSDGVSELILVHTPSFDLSSEVFEDSDDINR